MPLFVDPSRPLLSPEDSRPELNKLRVKYEVLCGPVLKDSFLMDLWKYRNTRQKKKKDWVRKLYINIKSPESVQVYNSSSMFPYIKRD